MGFLKRIFSIGSKRGKKRPHIVHNVDAGLRAIEEEEHEAAVGRLLRSSSTRFAVVSETDYSSLPPLPHPINEIIQPPAASTLSVASTSISQRGTYTVTVHGRQKHTPYEYPSAPETTQVKTIGPLEESNHLLGLRSDPSVASLLDMYDEHGRISENAFSNSPPSPKKEGRAQTRRNGSTLRQLLGNPSSVSSKNVNDISTVEGDISWAERFLGEADVSSTSSLGLCTPNTPGTKFPHNAHPDITIFSDNDLSVNSFENPAISSMEVELSVRADSVLSADNVSKIYDLYDNPEPKTPRRASQVFNFLTEKRRSKGVQDDERSLPELPSAFSFSSKEESPVRETRSRFSSDGSFESSHAPAVRAIPPTFNDTPASSTHDRHQPAYFASDILCSPMAQPLTSQPNNRINENEVKILMTGPTKVIVTAPTPSANRVPRGPRSQSRRMSSGNPKIRRPTALSERTRGGGNDASEDPFTALPSRKSHRRSASQNSSSSASRSLADQPLLEKGVSDRRTGIRSILTELDKENGSGLSAVPRIPSTPIRGKPKSKPSPRDSRSLFRAVITPAAFRPPVGMVPSPASSTDLSPVGRQLMTDVREQRTKAREADRRERKSMRVNIR